MKTKVYSLTLLFFFFNLVHNTNLRTQDVSSLGIAPNLIEQSINKVPYSPVILPHFITTIAYGDDISVYHFVSVPIPSGSPFTEIDSLPGVSYGGAFIDTTFYAIRNYNLITVSITTGVVTNIGQITGINELPTSLAYKQPNGPMYLGATDLTYSKLYTISPDSAAATLIGNITDCPGLIDFSINCEGKLYGTDIVNDNLIYIDTATGAGTIIGPLGVNLNYAQGASFDLSTGTLYLAAYTTESQLRTVNLTTGATTLVTSWNGHQIAAFGIPGSCAPPFVPCDLQTGPFLSVPDLMIPLTFYPIKAKITNAGTTTVTNIPVTFLVNGTQYGSTLTVPTLAPGAVDSSAVFAWAPTASGSTLLTIYTSLACDTSYKNDTANLTIVIGCAPIFSDDFEHGLNSWVITNNGGACVWSIENQLGNHILSADADACGPNTTINSTATIANNINCSNKYNVYLEFDDDFYVFHNDTSYIDASFDGGSTWTNLATWTASRRMTHEVILMPPAANNPAVKVRFKSVQPGWDWWWALDNVTVHACDLVGAIKNPNVIPVIYALSQNYPNPFNPVTNIIYQIPRPGNVKLIVYDILGREVKVLVEEFKKAGSYNVTFDGTSLASGVYLYRITAGDFSQTKKMILLK
jgi:hypothetical protein